MAQLREVVLRNKPTMRLMTVQVKEQDGKVIVTAFAPSTNTDKRWERPSVKEANTVINSLIRILTADGWEVLQDNS